ncbi:transposase [Liquorilactobacillus vini]|uniref:transposase n=1 Tax=Liquorilactobacillus vini TaxID=238015 RepID=UPI0009DB23D8
MAISNEYNYNPEEDLKAVSNNCESVFFLGASEGVNRKIKALKRSYYGFKNINHFYARIF